MIIVTGRTFDHRELLHRMGGKWNAARKGWIIQEATAGNLQQLRQTVGLIVSEIANDPGPESIMHGRTACYGDDVSYLNHFAPQNPRAFFGFSSLAKLVRYIEGLPAHFALDRERNGWAQGGAANVGCDSMSEALAIARKGWPEGASAASRVIEQLTLAKPRIRRHAPSLAGGTVNIGRLLSGDPRHMISRPKQPGKKVFTLFVEAGCFFGINAGTMVRRAAIIGAISDIMENEGYACTIVATDTSIERGQTYYQLAVTLKEAGERLSLGDLMFALGHPAFLRRFSFAVCSSVPETRSIWGSQGAPSNAFTDEHPCTPSEFYIPIIEKNTKTIDETLSLVIPKNLPIVVDTIKQGW